MRANLALPISLLAAFAMFLLPPPAMADPPVLVWNPAQHLPITPPNPVNCNNIPACSAFERVPSCLAANVEKCLDMKPCLGLKTDGQTLFISHFGGVYVEAGLNGIDVAYGGYSELC
jgi:hypothetical protein